MSRLGRLPRLFVSVVVACLIAGIAAAGVAQEASGRVRTLALGDIHGAYDELVGVLQAADVIDELGTWTAGTATFVQTGDMLDRGADARRVMDLMIQLQGEARRAGGQVVVLLGNHEIMNLVGAWQDVSPEILAAFTDRDSETRQREALREFERTLERDRAYRTSSRRVKRQIQQEWMESHPVGYVEMVRALGPEGSYGRWLRSLPIYYQADGILYMHAGISERYAGEPLARMNERVHEEIRAVDRYRSALRDDGKLLETADLNELVGAAVREFRDLVDLVPEHEVPDLPPPALPGADASLEEPEHWAPLAHIDHWYLFAPEGPMWFRGYARWGHEEVRGRLAPILEKLGVSTIVVGHTPQVQGVRVRAEGELYLIDTGMLTEVYGGRGELLVLEGGRAFTIRRSGQQRLLPLPAAHAPPTASR